MLRLLLWDVPSLRSEFITTWYAVSNDFEGISFTAAWKRVRGIVSASWAHLRQHGGEWIHPFRLRILDETVDI